MATELTGRHDTRRRFVPPPPQDFVRRTRSDGSAVLAGAFVVAVCMFLVRSGDVSAVEKSVLLAINGLPDALRGPVWLLQIPGALAFVAAVAVVALAVRRIRLGGAIAAAIPLKLALEWWVVKALIERERPFLTVPDAVIRETNSSSLGFPSGHAVLVFALAGLLAPYLGRRATVAVYTVATLACIARVYLGAHNPLDVVAGAAAGIMIAAALNLTVGVPQR